jgi:hypothetical protein
MAVRSAARAPASSASAAAGAAVINAIHNATGARIRNFPATPDKLLATREILDGGEQSIAGKRSASLSRHSRQTVGVSRLTRVAQHQNHGLCRAVSAGSNVTQQESR